CKIVQCWIPICSHISNRETCKLFRFPANDVECKVWAKLRRADTYPTKRYKIYGCHFKDGIGENGPTMFDWTKNTFFLFISPENISSMQ
ncbi:Hypothetical protein CINCED_3A022486, partial [Cinara cedri]